jgi:DnaJ-domain-containing protein 1
MLLLAWIVVCDDSPGEEKPAAFAQLATHLGLGPSITLLLNIAKGSCLRSLQLASEIIQLSILPQNKDATMDVCISLAAADHYLSISENLILRYVARLFGREYPLRSRYLAVTGTNLPAVGAPSSLDWWKAREGSTRRGHASRPETPPPGAINWGRLRALLVLGLDEGATEDDIRAAYRRLSQVHHPDKFHNSGPEAVRAATETFKRIQTAFELLTKR